MGTLLLQEWTFRGASMVGGAAKWRIRVLAAFALNFSVSVSPASAKG
jgi:hypothetical protein